MVNTRPQFQNNAQQDSSARTLFVYEEVWLKDLVPLQTNTAPISLQLSMEEFHRPESTYCQSTLSMRTHPHLNTHPTTVNNFTNNTTCNMCSCKTNNNPVQHVQNKQQQQTLPSPSGHSSNISSSSSSSSSSTRIQDGWLSLIRSTLLRRPRGRPRNTGYKVEFTEHVFSQLFNGKVENKDGLKIKNRIIGKHLYQNIKRRKPY